MWLMIFRNPTLPKKICAIYRHEMPVSLLAEKILNSDNAHV